MHTVYIKNGCPFVAVKPVVGSYWLLAEHTCPWKVRQWPNWDAVAETGCFNLKFWELEWRISRSWTDYVKIMESFRLKMEEDSLAIISSPFSVFLSLPPFITASHFLSAALSYACKHTCPSPFTAPHYYYYFFSNSQCGTMEQKLHRKQPPIRPALFMSRHCNACKREEEYMNKEEVSWGHTRWQHAHFCTFLHSSREYRHTHACTSVKAQSPSPILVNLQGYLNMKPLHHWLWRRNKTLKELFQIHP